MELVKAHVEVPDKNLHGGWLPPVIEIQFNPTDLLLSKSAEFTDLKLPGLDAPFRKHMCAGSETLEIKLYCDTSKQDPGSSRRDVRTHTEPHSQLAKAQPQTGFLLRIRFVWGKKLGFKGVAFEVQQSFAMFDAEGIPLRAPVRLVLREVKTLKEQHHRETPPSEQHRTKILQTSKQVETRQFLNPVFKLEILGKKLAHTVTEDTLTAVFRKELEELDSFELTINDWNHEASILKIKGGSPFLPGSSVKLLMGYRGESRPLKMMTGQIVPCRQNLPKGGIPILTVCGQSERCRSAIRVVEAKSVEQLSYGSNLVSFRASIRPASQLPQNARKKKSLRPRKIVVSRRGRTLGLPKLRANRRIKINEVGSRLDGLYYVTVTRHSVSTTRYTTRFVCQQLE